MSPLDVLTCLSLEFSPQLSSEENQIKLAHLYVKPCCFSLQLKSPNYKEWGPVPRDCSVLSTRWHFWSSVCKRYCMYTHTRLLPSKDSSCGGKVRVTQSQVVWMPAIYISCVISDVDKKKFWFQKHLMSTCARVCDPLTSWCSARFHGANQTAHTDAVWFLGVYLCICVWGRERERDRKPGEERWVELPGSAVTEPSSNLLAVSKSRPRGHKESCLVFQVESSLDRCKAADLQSRRRS